MSPICGIVVLILCKKAHKLYLNVKNLISIGNIVSKFKESSQILTSPRYKSMEQIITNEEFPIVMLLTTIRAEIEAQGAHEQSIILENEIKEIFSVMITEDKFQYLVNCQVSSLVSNKNGTSDPRALLKHCYLLCKSLDLESFFNQFVNNKNRLEENEFFINLDKTDEHGLISIISNCGVVC